MAVEHCPPSAWNRVRHRVEYAPAFDSSQATLLTVRNEHVKASCWLNVFEELEVAAEVRERRAAVGRVLRGEYAPEDILAVLRLLEASAQIESTNAPSGSQKSVHQPREEGDVPFSFARWKSSGQQRGGPSLLGRSPSELLKAIARWLNRDLQESDSPGDSSGGPLEKKRKVKLQESPEGKDSPGGGIDCYAVLDQICQAIPGKLESHPGLENAVELAELVASRAIDRTLRQELQIAPCLGWLDRFSRFSYPPTSQDDIRSVACAMACVVAYGLEQHGQDPQLPTLREQVERFVGHQLSSQMWA